MPEVTSNKMKLINVYACAVNKKAPAKSKFLPEFISHLIAEKNAMNELRFPSAIATFGG